MAYGESWKIGGYCLATILAKVMNQVISRTISVHFTGMNAQSTQFSRSGRVLCSLICIEVIVMQQGLQDTTI
jgi:hypothetical protein